MADRLSPLDVSFLYLEEPTTAMHVGSVMIFEPGEQGFDHARLVRLVAARIAFVPRYRQRIRWVPGRLANPVWVDDEHFDIGYHVRRSALPRPGSHAQLEELVARLQSRRLDRSRPLWEVSLVEGLAHDRFALVTKVHQALVDGINAVDLGQVVLDESDRVAEPPAQTWHPAPEPSLAELVAGAVADSVRRPTRILETLAAGFGDVRASATKTAEALGGLAVAARTAARPTPRSPLNRDISAHRRYRMVATDLADYRRIRNLSGTDRPRRRRIGTRPAAAAAHHPAQHPAQQPADRVVTSVNDVVLAVLSGALRMWLLGRGEPVDPGSVVRALVPMSVRVDDPAAAGAIGSRVSSLLIDLPTGEPSPIVRLHQVSYQTRAHRDAGQGVDAAALAGIAGFAPPTLHSLGTRVASGLSRRLFNLVVTNVPGPQQPLYLAGSRMLSTYPVIPLARGQALSVGLTSYDGGVYYGLNADRDAMNDLDLLAHCLVDALAEMSEAVR